MHPAKIEQSTLIGKLGNVLKVITLGETCIWYPIVASIGGKLVSHIESHRGPGSTESKKFSKSKNVPQNLCPFL